MLVGTFLPRYRGRQRPTYYLYKQPFFITLGVSVIHLLINPRLLGLAIALIGSTTALAAPTVILKPFAPTNAAEFGRQVARAGEYTLASSTQATAMLGDGTCQNSSTMSCFQGLVALYKGSSSSPERVYQFPGEYSFALPTSPDGWASYPIALDPTANFFLQAGSTLAISNDWLAFSTGNRMSWSKSGKIFLVGKTNGVWDSCPSTNGVVDCNNASEPLQFLMQPSNFKPLKEVEGSAFALSDRHLAVLRGDAIFMYTYSPSSRIWTQGPAIKPLENSVTGATEVRTNFVLDSHRLVVTATNSDNTNHEVQVYAFNALSSTWSKTDARATNLADFGYLMAMRDGVLAMASRANRDSSHPGPLMDGFLVFYGFDGTNKLVNKGIQTLPTSGKLLALEKDKAVITHYAAGSEEIATTYSFNVSQNTWSPFGKVYSYDFPRGEDIHANTYTGPAGVHDIDLSNGQLTLGYSGHNAAGTPLVGALFVQNFADTAVNRTCIVSLNKVSNCEFTNPYQGWSVANYNGAYSTSNFDQQSLNVQVYNSGSQPWHIQARTWVNLAVAGNYTLRFRAKKSTVGASTRVMQFSVGHNGAADNNWTSYASRSIQLSTEWQTYTYSLKNIPLDNNAVLDFNLGKSDIPSGNPSVDSISIDGVMLTKD